MCENGKEILIHMGCNCSRVSPSENPEVVCSGEVAPLPSQYAQLAWEVISGLFVHQ